MPSTISAGCIRKAAVSSKRSQSGALLSPGRPARLPSGAEQSRLDVSGRPRRRAGRRRAVFWYRAGPSRATRPRSTTSAGCISRAVACPRTISKRCTGIARPPSKATPPRTIISAGCTRTGWGCGRTIARRCVSMRGAERGDAAAQYNLGWMYQEGRGRPRRRTGGLSGIAAPPSKAIPSALNNLGWMYQTRRRRAARRSPGGGLVSQGRRAGLRRRPVQSRLDVSGGPGRAPERGQAAPGTARPRRRAMRHCPAIWLAL